MRKRCGFLRKFCFVLVLFLCVNLGYAKLEIIVKPSPDWGMIADVDVKKLCQNIVDHFEEHLRPENEIHNNVNVFRTFESNSHARLDPDPHVKYKIGILLHTGDMKIRVDDFYYFIYNFSHEFCHILHNFEVVTIGNPNLWFHEGIAFMSSIWALRQMAETWKKDSPFGTHVAQDGGRASFSDNFNHYANAYLNVFPGYQFDGTGEEWLKQHENVLRDEFFQTGGFTQYHLAAQLTFKFLPIFEEHPEAWNAVRKMPATKGKMHEYMQEWYDAVDIQDQQYVQAIAEVMGITVTSPVAALVELTSVKIDADVNDDGYVDLYDVMIVRSGMSNSTSYDTDLNNDGVTDEVDLHIVKSIAMQAIAAAAPGKKRVNITTWGSLKMR